MAAQQKQWKEVVEIGKEAESAGLIPSTMIEMKSFFFAALSENDLETAEHWKNLILTEKGNANYFLYQIKEFQNQSHLSKEAELILDQVRSFQRDGISVIQINIFLSGVRGISSLDQSP